MACLRIPRHLMKFVFVLYLYAHIACVLVAYIHIISMHNIDYVVCIAGVYCVRNFMCVYTYVCYASLKIILKSYFCVYVCAQCMFSL